MKVRYSHFAIALIVAVLLCNSVVKAQTVEADWTKWPQEELKHPDGTKFVSPSGNGEVMTFKVTALEAAAGQKITKFGSSDKEQILFALSIAGIDFDEEKSFARGQLDCTAITAEGDRDVVAGLVGEGKQCVFVIGLKAPTKKSGTKADKKSKTANATTKPNNTKSLSQN